MKVTDIPIIIPEDKYAAIKDGDSKGYELLNSVPYPTSATGGIYNEDYFKSVLNYLKQFPIPGSKTGHENQNVDFYTIGMSLEPNASKPGTGTAHFRIHVPSSGYDGVPDSNSSFIRACKAGTMEFSIVAVVEENKTDPISGEFIFDSEHGRPRLDAVGEGAMAQTVQANAKKREAEENKLEKEIMDLVGKGQIDWETPPPKSPYEAVHWNIVQNGKVMKKALSARQFMGTPEERVWSAKMLRKIGEQRAPKQKANTAEPIKLKISLNSKPKTPESFLITTTNLKVRLGEGVMQQEVQPESQQTVYQDNVLPEQPHFDDLMRETFGEQYEGWVGATNDYNIILLNGEQKKVEVINDVVYEIED